MTKLKSFREAMAVFWDVPSISSSASSSSSNDGLSALSPSSSNSCTPTRSAAARKVPSAIALLCCLVTFYHHLTGEETLGIGGCHALTFPGSAASSSFRFPRKRPSKMPSTRPPSSSSLDPTLTSSALYSSSLFTSRTSKPAERRRVWRPFFSLRKPSTATSAACRSSSSSSSTALHMVLTTPESIIEQASTVNLLDDLIDESVRTSARRPIMMQFDPSSGWIWRRWSGTIFAETWTSCVKNMAWALVIFVLHRTYPKVLSTYLAGFGTLWGQLLSITTFTLTFFVNQSYSLWRKCMELSRRLQGRLHDIGMNMASHAERKVPSNPTEKSTYTAASRQILELMSRYVRLFNLLTYASFTRSHRPILTPRGMRRLVERGLMTAQEREVLVDAGIPATQRHSVVLMWMIRLFVEGRASGHIQGGAGFESETMNKFHIIRSQYGAIGDELQGRMPLAYAHIVQVLVDVILWMFPIMAFSTGMSALLVVVGTGLLTISYQGLFDLAKQFLDPYDNENYGRGEDPLCVDTLIAETNAGSVRWMYGFEEMPYSAQRVSDGELYEYLLPVRGYSVEELAQMEEERIERERQMEEQRKREEEEEAERLRQEAVDAENQEEEVDDKAREAMDGEVSYSSLEIANTTAATAASAASTRRRTAIKGNKTEAGIEDSNEVDAISKTQNVTQMKEELDATTTATTVASTSSTSTTNERTVHKVTTLATGEPISLRTPGVVKAPTEEAVPTNMQTSNYLATLGQEKNGDAFDATATDQASIGAFVPEMVEYEMFQDLPWFDEVGPDGQELRMSQQLADENWPEADEGIQTKTMTWEEYQERLNEVKEDAENEARETIEILSAIPGAGDDEKLYTVTERRRRKKKNSPTYDQTRMDGISQLWGLPPEDPSDLEQYESPEKLEDVAFDSISQLCGGQASSSSPRRTSDNEVVGMGSFAGISGLWGSTIEDTGDRGVESSESDTMNQISGEATNGDSITSIDDSVDDDAGSSFVGLPWHDEKGADGQEYRISQMLADKEWEILDADPEDTAAMTLEEYQEEVEKIMEKAEEELRETEAILLSKPGNDPVGWDYDEDKLVPMSNSTDTDDEDDDDDGEEDIVTGAYLEALEMDSDDDDKTEPDGDPVFNGDTTNGEIVDEKETLAVEAPLEKTTADLIEKRVTDETNGDARTGMDEASVNDGSALGISEVATGDEAIVAEETWEDTDKADEGQEEEDDVVKGSDIIQPIFLAVEQSDVDNES